MFKLDANLRWLFTEWPLLERFAIARSAGFQGVELAFPYAYPATQIAERLRDNGLTLVQILTEVDWEAGERGIAALPERVDDYRRSARQAVEYATQTANPLIHILAGNVPAGVDRRRCYDTYVANVDFTAALAAQAGLTIVFEPICHARFNDFLLHRLDEGIDVIDQVNRPNVKLCFDTFHVQMEEGSLIDSLDRAWPYIGHIQVGNTPGRNEPGVGEIDFPAFFDALKRNGWNKWLGCEYTPSNSSLTSLAWGERFGLRSDV